MMRRSRISVKPNFRAGNRTGTEGEQASQGVSETGDNLPAVEAEEGARPAPSPQQNISLKELSEDVDIKDAPEIPSQINQPPGAPSSGAIASSAAPQRRMRISATPKLMGPKLTSTPRNRPSARMSSSTPSALPNEEHVQIHESPSEAQASVSICNDLPESGTPTKSTSPIKLPTQSSAMTQSSSPCAPSTSGLQKSPVHGKKSMKASPPQPDQVPQQPTQEPEAPECPSSSDLSSFSITPSHCDKASSSEMTEKSSEKDRILRALKLKELMKIERRKDIQMVKRRVGHKGYTDLDRSKMTMRDLIYYLPNTSPMRSSIECEENQAETIIPSSPKQQIKTAEGDEEDEEPENEEMLMPKVKVAEDGSIILDEESLTVRVQRPSNTKVLESSAALFERGSTTTYSSFRSLNYVKSWSVRETDLFFLAISMVGTDFSLMGQLLTHRSRIAIKNKFKKEERVNPWRVDKALRNKRPYDKDFFSYLLEKVLAKDKDKRKSIKLILPKTRKSRKSKGNTDDEDNYENVFEIDDHEELEDDGDVRVEKENEDVSNVKEADTSVPAKKRHKRTRDVSKDIENDNKDKNRTEGKRKRQRKCSKKTREVHSSDDTEGESKLNAEGDTINVNKEDELKRSTSASKRRRKRSENDEEEQNVKPVKGKKKGKQLKKSLKVECDHEESVKEHEESSIMDEDGSDIKKKRKRAKNSDLDGDEPAKGKKNTKRKKALKSTVKEEGTTQEGEASEDLQKAEKSNTPAAAEVADNVPPKATRRSKKPLPNLATTRNRKSNKPEACAEVERESQDENSHESILKATGSPLEDKRLQMQAVVVLEKTPPRQDNLLGSLKIQCQNNELEPSLSSPASPSSSESSSAKQTRMQRAERVKRDLSTSGKGNDESRRRKGVMDQGEAEPKSPMVLLEQITQEEQENDNSLNENLTDLSCLRDFNSQSFQRRPMVVSSPEEVDMVLNASDQSADEEPSVSPLDLSLNTELSFPLQCSKLLEDNDEEAEVDCVFEEDEERTNERASHEERNCEVLELTESALAQPDISNLRNISTSIKPEVCSQPEVTQSKVTTSCLMDEAEPLVQPIACKDVTAVATVLESSPPLVVLDNVDPICIKPKATLTQEPVSTEITTLGTSLVGSDVMEEPKKAMLPTLLKESALASSEITEKSKLTPTRSGLGSQRSLQTTPEVKRELHTSLEGPETFTLETFQGSSESKEDTQESAMASPETKATMQDCLIAPESKKDSQEEVSVQTSSASLSPEHGIRPTRRSRFLKPKPNLSQKSRVSVLQNERQDLKTPSTLKPKSSKPITPEKLLHSPAADEHCAIEDFSKKDFTKEEEVSQSNAMDQMESESTKVPDQGTITTLTLSRASADEPQVVSECHSSRCEVDPILPCNTLTLPQPSQTREDTGSGRMILPSENVCAPAEIVHLDEDGHNDKEPTFILTLYEIPVTRAYLPSSSNDSVITSDLPTVETRSSLGFSDQACTLPSTTESYRIDSLPMESSGPEKVCLQNELGVGTEDLAVTVKEQISTSQEITSPHTKDDSDASANLEMCILSIDPDSECKKGSEFSPLDFAPRIQSTSGFDVSKCKETSSASATENFATTYEPISLDTKDEESDSSGNLETGIPNMEPNIPSFLYSKEGSSDGVTQDWAENVKEQISEHMTSHEPILQATKDEENDACADLETGIPHLAPYTECKKGSEIAPFEDVVPRNQSKHFGISISKCVETLPGDTEDSQQSERVSHLVMADVFVPVSEQTGDDSCKDRTMDVACKLHSKEACTVSLPERQYTPYKELTKVDHSPSNPLVHFESTEESKDTPPLSLDKKAPARRSAIRKVKPQPKLVKRACAKDDSSKTDELAKEPNKITTSTVVLPASHKENLAGISNTTDENSVDRTPSIKENKTSVSKDNEVKAKTITEDHPKMSPVDLAPTESKPTSTALNLSREPKLEEKNCKNVTGNTTIKDDVESSAKDKDLSVLISSEGANVEPCCEDMHFSLMKTSGSGSSTVDSEAETQGVSHMVLPDAFVLVSDEMEGDLSNNWTASIESCSQSVSLPKSGAHFQKELKNEAVSQTSTKSAQNQSPLVDIKTPVRKRGNQEVSTCTNNDSNQLSQSTCPQARTPPSQLITPLQNENMVLPEEKLQRKHHIMPCTVRLSSLDTIAKILNAPQLGDGKSNDESTVVSSPTCHASVTLPEESKTALLFKERALKDPELEKKSPSRRKGTKNESSPHTKCGHLKPTQTRQLAITDWAKKKPAANQEEKESVRSPQMESSLKAKVMPQVIIETACSKSHHTDSEETECSHLVPALAEAKKVSSVSKEVKRSSEVVNESVEEPSVSQVKKTPARQRAKVQVKPILSKRSCTKSEGNTSTTNLSQPSRITSPTRQRARAAREEESDNKTNQPVKEDSIASSMEANSENTESSLITSGPQSHKKPQDTWPRVVLPRVKLWTTEAGSASSTPTSSPARVSERASPPVTPSQLKKSPTQSSSPTASEDPPDDPSRVSQFSSVISSLK